MRILVGSPAYGHMAHTGHSDCVVRFMMAGAKRGWEMSRCVIPNDSVLPNARARCAQQARVLKADLLFWDVDLEASVEHVMGMVDTRHDVVAISCPQKHIFWDRVLAAVQLNPKITPEELEYAGANCIGNFVNPADIRVDATQCIEMREMGTGIMLIRSHVLERFAEAHPELRYVPDQRSVRNPHDDSRDELVGIFEHAIIDGRRLSEDYNFCRMWRALGGKVHCYLAGEATHWGPHGFRGRMVDKMRPVET